MWRGELKAIKRPRDLPETALVGAAQTAIPSGGLGDCL